MMFEIIIVIYEWKMIVRRSEMKKKKRKEYRKWENLMRINYEVKDR